MTQISDHPLEPLCDKILKYYPDAKIDLLKKAYQFAAQAHQGQFRQSGEPYLNHPISVAETLAELQLDLPSIITGLLHDTVEDTSVTLSDIQTEFGPIVAQLVDGVTKLSKISFKTSAEKQAENFRKMILAMAKDIRVILIKLADRLNNMKTLEYLPLEKQILISQETLDIYSPIANRLGISWIKIELEDLCLRYLHPDVYYRLAKKISKTKKERENYIQEVTNILEERLKEYNIQGQVSGRAKHFFSIFKKMERRNVDFEQVFDIIAYRIIVENITECYKTLGVIHAAYRPVPGRFKDYIAMPKANAYQSLHTTVIGPHGQRIEIQIRTQEMHQVAEGGIAAHWRYKEGKFEKRSHENLEWVNRLLEWHKDLSDPNEFLETVKIDLFGEDIFVFTPQGEVKQLPHGSTPLDFAYCIHTDIGNHCSGAKVNGHLTPLKNRLKSGDTVEILTTANQHPSKDWIKIVKTSRARLKIKNYIKEHERGHALILGKELLEKTLKSFHFSISKIDQSEDFSKTLQQLNCKNINELFIAIGYGRVTTDLLIKKLFPQEIFPQKKSESIENQSFLKRVFYAAQQRSEAKNAIKVDGHDDILIRFGKCCNPIPGDRIIGFITRGRGITIHTAFCTKSLDQDPVRKVDVQWNLNHKTVIRRQIRVKIIANQEPELFTFISQTIQSCGLIIVSAQIQPMNDYKTIAQFDVQIENIQQLQKLTSTLERKKDIIHIERLRS